MKMSMTLTAKLVLLLIIISLLSAGCASGLDRTARHTDGNSTGIFLSNPILFERGNWNRELGAVTAELFDGDSGSFENGVYFANEQTGWRFLFENPVNASAYERLIIEVRESIPQMGWQAGGQLINYYPQAFEHDGEMTHYAVFGYLHDEFTANQRLTFNLNSDFVNDLQTEHQLDINSIAGFSVKAAELGGQLTIVRAYFE